MCSLLPSEPWHLDSEHSSTDSADHTLLTWVGEDLFGLSDVDKLLLRLLLFLWILEVVRVPLLCKLPVSFDDLFFLGRSARQKADFRIHAAYLSTWDVIKTVCLIHFDFPCSTYKLLSWNNATKVKKRTSWLPGSCNNPSSETVWEVVELSPGLLLSDGHSRCVFLQSRSPWWLEIKQQDTISITSPSAAANGKWSTGLWDVHGWK